MTVNRTVDQPFPVSFFSEGSNLRGWFFPAKGTGSFPTVILLHGYPGNEREPLGLGGRMIKEGINALAFNYRGIYGSEGIFSHQNSLADVSAAIAYLKSPGVAQELAVDTTKIALAGYSWGGGMALLGSLREPSVPKVASIAGANLGEIARRCLEDEEFRKLGEQLHEECQREGVARYGMSVRAFVASVIETMDDFDLVRHAEELANKDILLIGGWRDPDATIERHILPLFRALQEYESEKLSIEVFDTDHSFTGVEEELAQRIVSWIKN